MAVLILPCLAQFLTHGMLEDLGNLQRKERKYELDAVHQKKTMNQSHGERNTLVKIMPLEYLTRSNTSQ
jgi:hypothetical protein